MTCWRDYRIDILVGVTGLEPAASSFRKILGRGDRARTCGLLVPNQAL